MAESPLGPAELDLLEDALEDLEQPGALERWLEDDPAVAVRERLIDYQSILAASREALPLEEVPAGVLDDVLAEARRAAATPAAAMVVQESWWTRFRRTFMVPAIALAGTAVLVLWIGKPEDQAALTDPPPPEAETPAAAKPAGKVKVQFIDPEEEQGLEEDQRALDDEEFGAMAREAEKAQAEPTAASTPTPAEPLTEESDKTDDSLKKAEDAKPGMGSLGDAPGDEQKQAGRKSGGAAGPASGRWDLINQGDRARQSGDCVEARDYYSVALEDDEARVRARAFAGIGLCDERAGDGPAADGNFERARELDGEVDAFIDSQQQRSRPSAKKRKKSKRKSKVSLDQAMDPFN